MNEYDLQYSPLSPIWEDEDGLTEEERQDLKDQAADEAYDSMKDDQ